MGFGDFTSFYTGNVPVFCYNTVDVNAGNMNVGSGSTFTGVLLEDVGSVTFFGDVKVGGNSFVYNNMYTKTNSIFPKTTVTMDIGTLVQKSLTMSAGTTWLLTGTSSNSWTINYIYLVPGAVFSCAPTSSGLVDISQNFVTTGGTIDTCGLTVDSHASLTNNINIINGASISVFNTATANIWCNPPAGIFQFDASGTLGGSWFNMGTSIFNCSTAWNNGMDCGNNPSMGTTTWCPTCFRTAGPTNCGGTYKPIPIVVSSTGGGGGSGSTGGAADPSGRVSWLIALLMVVSCITQLRL